MKSLKLILIILAIVLVSGYYFVSNSGEDMTGFVVDDDLSDLYSSIRGIEYENLTNVTREQAMESLIEGEQIVAEMIEKELPFVFMADKLLEAERIFEQAEYADILRGVNISWAEKLEAKEALRLLDWKKITYDGVITQINTIKKRRDKSLVIYDSLISTKISLMRESGSEIPITGMVFLIEEVNESTGEDIFISYSAGDFDEKTKELFDEASRAFYEDREDAGDLLVELREHMEAQKLESATANVLKNNLTNFIKRNLITILIFLILFGGIGYAFYGNFYRKLLGEEIERMKLERKAILKLMKEAQQDRFKDNKISEFIYEIKMRRYRDRLAFMKVKLPVLEAKVLAGEKDSEGKTIEKRSTEVKKEEDAE